MESKFNYTIVGLFVVVLFTGFIGVSFWLSTEGTIKRHVYYSIYVTESVSGLSKQSPVKFNGVDVGYVKDIEINQNNLQEVQIIVSVEADVPINQGTVAVLSSQGLTGIMYVELEAKAPSAPPIKLIAGQPHPIAGNRSACLPGNDRPNPEPCRAILFPHLRTGEMANRMT